MKVFGEFLLLVCTSILVGFAVFDAVNGNALAAAISSGIAVYCALVFLWTKEPR